MRLVTSSTVRITVFSSSSRCSLAPCDTSPSRTNSAQPPRQTHSIHILHLCNASIAFLVSLSSAESIPPQLPCFDDCRLVTLPRTTGLTQWIQRLCHHSLLLSAPNPHTRAETSTRATCSHTAATFLQESNVCPFSDSPYLCLCSQSFLFPFLSLQSCRSLSTDCHADTDMFSRPQSVDASILQLLALPAASYRCAGSFQELFDVCG